MNAIVLLGPTAVLAVWMHRGFREALVYVGVPCLLLFPAYYELELRGLPEVNFWNFTFAALLGTLVPEPPGDDRLDSLHPGLPARDK